MYSPQYKYNTYLDVFFNIARFLVYRNVIIKIFSSIKEINNIPKWFKAFTDSKSSSLVKRNLSFTSGNVFSFLQRFDEKTTGILFNSYICFKKLPIKLSKRSLISGGSLILKNLRKYNAVKHLGINNFWSRVFDSRNKYHAFNLEVKKINCF